MKREEIDRILRPYYPNPGCRQETVDNLLIMGDAKTREVLTQLECDYANVNHQIFAKFLTDEEFAIMNQLVQNVGGDLQVACYYYPYKYMKAYAEGGTMDFKMGEVENPRMQNIINMMHVINASRKVTGKQLSKEEILKQIEEVKKKPSNEIIDFQRNYIEGMEEESKAFFKNIKKASQQKPAPAQQQVVLQTTVPQQQVKVSPTVGTQQMVVQKEENNLVDAKGYGFDLSKLVEIENYGLNNTLLHGDSQVGLSNANLTSTLEGGSNVVNNQTQGYGYFNINDIVKPSINEVTANEIQKNDFLSALVMSPEEEASHFHGFDLNKVGEGNTYEEDMAFAHNMVHPNVALQMQQQEMATQNNGFGFNNGYGVNNGYGINNGNGTMNGYTQYGTFINPVASQQYAKTNFTTPSTPPPAKFAGDGTEEGAKSVMDQIKAMGLTVHHLDGTPKREPDPTSTSIANMMTKPTSDGGGQLNLSSGLTRYFYGCKPINKMFDEDDPDYLKKVAAEMKRRQSPGYDMGEHIAELDPVLNGYPFKDDENNAIYDIHVTNRNNGIFKEKITREQIEARKEAYRHGAKPLLQPEPYDKSRVNTEDDYNYDTSSKMQRKLPLKNKTNEQKIVKKFTAPDTKMVGSSIPSPMPSFSSGVTFGGVPKYDSNVRYPNMPNNVDNLKVPNYFYPETDMTLFNPTKEELDAGLVPYVAVSRHGVIENEEEFNYYMERAKKRRENETFKWDGPRVFVSRNGEEPPWAEAERQWRKERAALDYKEACILKVRAQNNEYDYSIAKELRRYDANLADDFLWYKQNRSLEEFEQFKQECLTELFKYRNADPMANAKSEITKKEDGTLDFKAPTKSYTIDDLKEMAEKSRKKAEESSTSGLAKSIISSYQKQADIVNKAVSNKLGMKDDKMTIRKILDKIASLNNIQVVAYGDKSVVNKVTSLPPIEVNANTQYKIWKKLKRMCYSGDKERFDEEFDKWWFGPKYLEKQMSKTQKYREYRLKAQGVLDAQINRELITPEKAYAAQMAFREHGLANAAKFDQGSVRPDMTLGEWLDNWMFLETRYMEMKIEEYNRNLRNRYNPKRYMELVEQSAMQDAAARGETYHFCDSKEYNDKRQRFISTIFSSMGKRGAIS